MKILACQIQVPTVVTAGQRDQHVDHIATLVTDHIEEAGGVDLAVLPELSTITYSKEAFENVSQLAEGLNGPSFKVFSKVARKTGAAICFGMPRRDDDGSFRISQVVIGSKGELVGYYDKMHIAQFGESIEKPYFNPGRHLLVFDVAGIRTAPIICYDHRFPELTRTLALKHGVDLILHPVAFYRDSTFASWHQCVITRAIENQVHFLSLNRAGENYGDSVFAPPWIDGWKQPLEFGDKESFRVLEVDHAYTAEIRQAYPYRRDKVDNYDDLPLL
ncbi:MAG: carbon-nitrogen hydrolase family protein [Rhodospirillaceae bacterium]|nr:carbon-nitrogen hydrolase family protein [Rhodospirillaceae bacterium]